VVNDTVGGQPIAIFWVEGTASALDTGSIALGRDVGSAAAYSRVLGELDLTFVLVNVQILDRETGSEWNVLGQALAGELMGKQLAPVVGINHFWFSPAIQFLPPPARQNSARQVLTRGAKGDRIIFDLSNIFYLKEIP
jgi:hypothetical protein